MSLRVLVIPEDPTNNGYRGLLEVCPELKELESRLREVLKSI